MKNIKTLILLLACFVAIATPPLPSNAATADTGYTAVAAGRWYSVALKTDGSLWSWGNIYNGQFGNGVTQRILTPKQIGSGYTAISTSMDHAFALKADGSLWAWGDNASGQLGDGTTTPSLTPKQIGSGYSAISAGYNHTAALKPDGSLWTWGSNDYGQLGDGTTKRSLVPKQIGTASYTAISAGGAHTIALKADGSLWAWGDNSSGELGDGTTTPSLVPKQVGSGYSAISAGWYYSMALKSDGSLWVWGSNYAGRLGDGNLFNGFMPQLTNVLAPKQIGTGYFAIATGESHSLALKSDRSLWAWGINYYGELGYGTPRPTLVPKQIGTDAYNAIASGGYHTVALKPDGSLWTWGNNYYGQLGDGTTANSLVPKQIIDTGYTETPDTTAPSVPAGLTVTSQTIGGYVNLFWTPSTDNVGVSIYKIYREGVWTTDISTVSGCGVSGDCNAATVAGLAIDRFTVSACDVAGNCSAQSAAASLTSSTQVPSVPGGLTATAVGATQVDLSWTPSVGNMGIVNYEIHRTSAKTCAARPGSMDCDTGPIHVTKLLTTLSGNPPQTSYSDTGTTPSTFYSYLVRACDAAGNCSALSEPVSTTTQPLPVTLKKPPIATATSYGPLINQTLRIAMAPPASVSNLGTGTSIFVAAVLPGGDTYFWNGNSWFPYTSCAAAPVSSWWGLDSTQYLDVVPTPTDLSFLKGTKIYVGYGIGTPYTTANAGIGATDVEACIDMLNNSTYTQAYTIN